MIDPSAFISYAQYNEDVILSALFYDVKKGFYVDVGANHPLIDSVTKAFYKQGWHGINIEPIERLYKLIAKDRPQDINLQIGVGAEEGLQNFREYTDLPGHSTFDTKQKNAESQDLVHQDYKVKLQSLAQIFGEHEVGHIHFLKIDVEGFEHEVIKGNNWQKYRPEVICIEANHVSENWKQELKKNDYDLFLFDGLNEYYVEKKSWWRTQDFAERAAVLDYSALKYHHWKSWHDSQGAFQKQVAAQHNEITRLTDLATLSLKGRGLTSRLKRASYGLTIDLYRFYKRRPKK